jgi:hypothetical protein
MLLDESVKKSASHRPHDNLASRKVSTVAEIKLGAWVNTDKQVISKFMPSFYMFFIQ